VLCDATAGAFTITLPPLAGHLDQRYLIKKIDSSGNPITVVGLIDGEPNQVLASQNDGMALAANAAGWWIG
jgi:hypothetical protein